MRFFWRGGMVRQQTIARSNIFSKTGDRATRRWKNRKPDFMKALDSYDTDINDEPAIQDNEEGQDENETKRLGATFVKTKHGSTIDHNTVTAIPTDADVLPTPDSEQEEVEVRRGKKAEDDDKAEPELSRAVASTIAKQQFKEKLAAAQANFGKLAKLPKEAANDNTRPTVSWPLMEQLTRSTFEPNRERRAKMAASARYILQLIDTAIADQVGASIHIPGKNATTDHDVQRTESGNVYFEHGQTLDRRKVTYDNKDGEAGAERYSGSVRRAKKSNPVGGFDPHRDDPFPVRGLVAREELDVIIAAVGPMWPLLLATMIQNYSMTDVGEALGVKSAQASIVGTAFIRFALTVAMEALDRMNGDKDEPQRKLPMPDKSRGHFLNLSRGPVIAKNDIKIAA
jgi:hypothetical protein